MSKFQHIVDVAELEHRKLSLKDSPASQTQSKVDINERHKPKKLQSKIFQANDEDGMKVSKNTFSAESKSKIKVPVLIQPNVKVLNLKKQAASPILPCYLLRNTSTEKSELNYTNVCKYLK